MQYVKFNFVFRMCEKRNCTETTFHINSIPDAYHNRIGIYSYAWEIVLGVFFCFFVVVVFVFIILFLLLLIDQYLCCCRSR